jgi:hypothetical protein
VELVIWKVPDPVRGSDHPYQYRLVLIDAGRCVVRYDNEAGKGDHRHYGELEVSHPFKGLEQLQADFWADVETWRSGQ